MHGISWPPACLSSQQIGLFLETESFRESWSAFRTLERRDVIFESWICVQLVELFFFFWMADAFSTLDTFFFERRYFPEHLSRLAKYCLKSEVIA